MKKPWRVTVAVVGLFAGMASPLLKAAGSADWLAMVTLGMALVALFLGVLKLWSSPVACLGWLLMTIASIGVSAVFTQPLWMSVFGEVRTDCQVIDEWEVERDRAPSYDVSKVRCGDRVVSYKPYQSASEYIGDVGERTSLVFDRTGLINPVRPSDLTTTGAWALPGVALLGLLFIAFCATWPAEPGKPKVEQEFL
ncbi:hypothetical protein [Saccharothrix coeruleofusca]|uniref:Uncharacterized protein n=1 Tax=Saccharothrix coeruleofusca TaxID=33919 RepID=A0A918AQG1_9PSEU|nr:hypothetical protein [Saccharothrix coeruleofusca]GGP69580.1 hypothetical protein GCM10010185_48050 [Saccharothrix coeruleofusca]